MKMKHLLAAILLSATTFSFSQTLSMGPRLGANFTTFGGFDNSSYKPGAMGGVFIVYSKREHLGFGAELLFSGEGSKYKILATNGTTNYTYDYNTRLNYVRIPLQVMYFFNEVGDKFRPKLAVGPTLGYLVSAKQKLTTTTQTNGSASSFDTESTSLDNFYKLDVGLSLGLGFNYKMLRNTWLNCDARYNFGLMDINSNNFINSEKVNNHGASISLGLAWGINKKE